eukprot:192819-Chlamydomonas_euryale.AAC.9
MLSSDWSARTTACGDPASCPLPALPCPLCCTALPDLLSFLPCPARPCPARFAALPCSLCCPLVCQNHVVKRLMRG